MMTSSPLEAPQRNPKRLLQFPSQPLNRRPMAPSHQTVMTYLKKTISLVAVVAVVELVRSHHLLLQLKLRKRRQQSKIHRLWLPLSGHRDPTISLPAHQSPISTTTKTAMIYSRLAPISHLRTNLHHKSQELNSQLLLLLQHQRKKHLRK